MKNIVHTTTIILAIFLFNACLDDIEILSSITAPVAKDDNASLGNGSSTTIDILSNDTANENRILDTSSVTITKDVSEGSTVIRSNGTVTYTSDGIFIGDETFTYTVKDTNGTTSNTATVNITITEASIEEVGVTESEESTETTEDSIAPTAVDDTATTTTATSIVINILDNDIDNGDGLSGVNIITDTINGSTIINASSTITYTPNTTFIGTETFTYEVEDTNGVNSNTAKVTITVSSI